MLNDSQIIGFWIVYDFSWLNSIHANDYDSVQFNTHSRHSRVSKQMPFKHWIYVLFLFSFHFLPRLFGAFRNRKYAIWILSISILFRNCVVEWRKTERKCILISNDVFTWTITSCDSEPFRISFEWYLFYFFSLSLMQVSHSIFKCSVFLVPSVFYLCFEKGKKYGHHPLQHHPS